MENMKAIRIHNYGGPEMLRFEDAPRPTPGSGELLITVHAASVNAIDWKIRAGYLKGCLSCPPALHSRLVCIGYCRGVRFRCHQIQERR